MRPVLFCHGVPGSPADVEVLRRANPQVEIEAVDLFEVAPDGSQDAFAAIIDKKARSAGQEGLHLVGFSIGAMVAIRMAAARPGLVSRLTLVSPAAPLSLGDFLPDMAGAPVFRLAMARPRVLWALTVVQGFGARVAPDRLIGMLFRDCGPMERALLDDPAFRVILQSALVESLVRKRSSYLQYLAAYVSDWSDQLDFVRCPVDLWQGSNDTWSPPEMSEALRRRLGDKATVRMVPEAEHYSTLARVEL